MSISKDPTETDGSEKSFIDAVDRFLDELGGLASKLTDGREFYEFLVNRLRLITQSQRVSIIVAGPNSECLSVVSDQAENVDANTPIAIEFERLHQMRDSDLPITIGQGKSRLFAKSIFSDDETPKALVIQRHADDTEAMIVVYSDLVQAVAGFADEFERGQAIKRQKQRFRRMAGFIELAKNSHSSLSSKHIGYHLANDSRALLNADRVWVYSVYGRQRLLACSSVSEVDSRSNTAKQMRSIVSEAVRHGQSYFFSRAELKKIPAKYRGLQRYMDSTAVQGLYVFLVTPKNSRKPSQVIVVECFEPHDQIQLVNLLNKITECAQDAFGNSQKWERLPFRNLLAGLTVVTDQFRIQALPRTVPLLLIAAAMVISLFAIQTDFDIRVEGQIRPVVERNVFAPANGIVESIDVEYGDSVAAKQVLMKISSPDYQLKLKQLQGRIQSLKKDLEAKQLSQIQASRTAQRDDAFTEKLTAEIEQAKISIQLLNDDISFYLDLTDELSLRSPIDGQVFTRDLRQQLANRPVNRGDRMISIADTQGSWHLVFEVSDVDLGYIEQARQNPEQSELAVEYQINSETDSERTAKIDQFDRFNSVDETGKSFVKAYAPFQREGIENPRIGQTVTGNVKCGKRSLFFVWTRDLRDFLRSTFLWN